VNIIRQRKSNKLTTKLRVLIESLYVNTPLVHNITTIMNAILWSLEFSAVWLPSYLYTSFPHESRYRSRVFIGILGRGELGMAVRIWFRSLKVNCGVVSRCCESILLWKLAGLMGLIQVEGCSLFWICSSSQWKLCSLTDEILIFCWAIGHCLQYQEHHIRTWVGSCFV